MADVLLIIAQKDYQPIEFGNTKEVLQKDFKIDVASVTTDVAIATDGSSYQPDLAIKDAKVDDYKSIAVIGGQGALALSENSDLLNLIKEFNNQGKIVAAICISPAILAKAGVLQGKKATVFPAEIGINALKQAGATYTEEDVTKDGIIITANGPSAAIKFGEAIAEALK